MYEQYAVILSSLVLGTMVGYILSAVVTAQFFLFMEFPFALNFPYDLLYTMVIMSILTTFYAVLVPVNEVNQ